MFRVAIVEDHTLVRQTLARLVDSYDRFEVVAEASGASEAMPRLRGAEPDVAILDINLGVDSGLDLAVEVRRELPGTRIIFLTMHEDETTLRGAFAFGADGFISKSAPAAELFQALTTICDGGSFVSLDLSRKVMALAGGRNGPASDLTERELEVLRLLAAGRRPTEIAEELYLSIKTVKNHLTHTYAKLAVSTAAQAVSEAYKQRLIRVDEHVE